MSSIPKTVAGAPLSSEQFQYLDGFFQGMKNRGLSFSDVAPEAGPKPKKLTAEEQLKQEINLFDIFTELRSKAKTNTPPDKADLFRFKWNGLFWLAPVHDAYMCRLRIPGGVVTSKQFTELADISDDLASGYLQFTTRNNLQLRVIKPKDTLELIRRIEACGLKTRGSGADNLRNFTATPTSGIDRYELIDVMPYIADLALMVQNSAEFYDLPRKFNISIDSGGLVGVAEDTNDIGMRAVKMDGKVYFRILLGGVTGHEEFAEDAGFLCRPEDVVDVCAALIRVWMRHGSRASRGKARMIYLIKEWGYSKYMEETQKLLGFDLIPLVESKLEGIDKPREPHPHIGAYPQKQAGLNYLGVYIPVGNLPSDGARAIARIAEEFGRGELRLTIFQNLLIPHIPDEKLEAAKAALSAAGIGCEASYIRGGAAACTGSRYCKFASADTKANTLSLIEYLESKVTLDQPINIHTTGCPHSCAQHYIGDLGLLACKVKMEGQADPVEGYHVFVGGGFGKDNKKLGRQLWKSIPAGPILHKKIEALLRAYLEKREENENFQSFTTRHSIEELDALVAA